MARRLHGLGFLAFSIVAGCGGDPNDPQTWVDKLDRGAERQEAIEKIREIYRNELNKNDGNHEAASVKALAAKLAPGVIDAARKYKDDHESRQKMIELLGELRDRRAIPLFVEALDFTPELTEDQACAGADGLGLLQAREGVQPMIKLLGRITGNRAADNRMKRSVVVAFGLIKDPESVPALIELLDKTAEEQDFLINKLAAIALGDIGDPRAVPVLIRALYMAGRGATIYQQARVSLAKIGGKNVSPHLIKAMQREDAELNRMAKALDFDGLNPGILEEKCERILADLGDASCIDPLVGMLEGGKREPANDDERRDPPWVGPVRGWAGQALAHVATSEADVTRVIDAIIPYTANEKFPHEAHPDLYEALGYTGNARALEYLSKRMGERGEYEELMRFSAAKALARWGRKGSLPALQRLRAGESEAVKTDFKDMFDELEKWAGPAEECDSDVACWGRKLGDPDKIVAEKAANMLGVLGTGSAEARTALLQHADHTEVDVRKAILSSLERITPEGCPECLTRLEAILAAEEGRSRLSVAHNEAAVVIAQLRQRGGGR